MLELFHRPLDGDSVGQGETAKRVRTTQRSAGVSDWEHVPVLPRSGIIYRTFPTGVWFPTATSAQWALLMWLWTHPVSCGLIIITHSAKTRLLVPAVPEVWGRSRTGPVWLIFTCMQAATAGLYRCVPKSCSLPSRKKRSLKQQHWERCDICDKLSRSYIYSAFLINLSPRTLVRIHWHARN